MADRSFLGDHHDVAFNSCLSRHDDWEDVELDQLRMDIEEMEIDVMAMKNTTAHAIENAEKARQKAVEAKTKYRERFENMNRDMTYKCMIYLDLIDVYEYNRMSMAPDQENKINDLRKRGGLNK